MSKMKPSASWLLPILATLSACGGGGGSGRGGGLVSAPPPVQGPSSPPNPTPPDKLIAAATTSQAFPSHGAALYSDGGLNFSFDAATGKYLVTTPGNTTPTPLQRDPQYSPPAGEPYMEFVGEAGLHVGVRAPTRLPDPQVVYSYSNLASWSYPRPVGDGVRTTGATSFGIPATSVPRTGTATYVGIMDGRTTEKDRYEGELTAGIVSGSVNLKADFGSGSLTGTLSPTLNLTSGNYALGTLPVNPPAWSVGSANFNERLPRGTGPFTNPQVWGTFTGPQAQEMVGGFEFDYRSPVDGLSQKAGGAFIANQSP